MGSEMCIRDRSTTGQAGVAIVLTGHARRCLTGYLTVSDRIILCRLDTKPVPLALIQVYAPTSSHSEEEINMFYDQLQTTLGTVRSNEMAIIMGDFNAKVGCGADAECGIGEFGLGTRNSSGNILADFCKANDLDLVNTFFNHHPRRRYTWISPDETTRNQIDFIAVPRNWRKSVLTL